MNGQGHGDVASVLMANNFDPNSLRPYIGHDGRSYITQNSGQSDAGGNPTYNQLVTNAPATLRKDDWIQLDTAILKAAKPRLNAVGDLRAAGLQLTIPNGMGKTVLEHETQSDITAATISMDGIRKSDGDRPQFNLQSLPLPIIHKDFSFSARQVMASRNGGSPLDTTTAELAGRRVAEEAEKLLLGESATYSYGGGSVYGYTNFPQRLTKTITAPTTSNHPTTVAEVLAMRKQSTDNNYFGPWALYYSPAWYGMMDEDYTATVNQPWTLRSRLQQIEGITAVRPADYLTGTTILLVQQTPDVARMVVGMDITTVQWETNGGMELNFKVMAIMVPQLRSDYNSATGIVHGSV
tara:strand:- start:7415 stop:8470 length:1056 start_codon:yes stop_codon:yes gene_type:complete